MSFVHRQMLDRVGLTDAFVEPVTGSAINLSENPKNPMQIHLRVVDYKGDRFTEEELNCWMSLDADTIFELFKLCERRKDTLCARYLPGALNPKVTQMHCWIGPDGIADVEVLLSADRKN